MNKLLIAISCVILSITASAENRKDLQTNSGWRVMADHQMPISLQKQRGHIIVQATPNGAPESFPRIHLDVPPEDWRQFNKVQIELKLTSNNKDITNNGKKLAFCLYDKNLLLPQSKTATQQIVAYKQVQADKWQIIEIDISKAQRGKVIGFDIYLYESACPANDNFQIEFKKISLTGPEKGKPVFDGKSLSFKTFRQVPDKTIGRIRTADGLVLSITANGILNQISKDSVQMGSAKHGLYGILVKDVKSNLPPVRVKGKIVSSKNSITQKSTLEKLQLQVDAKYAVRENSIVISGNVLSLNNKDRAITVYVALPLNPGNYEFAQSLDAGANPFAIARNVANYEQSMTKYPFCAATSRELSTGLALAVDLGQPSVYRFVCNPGLNVLYAAFDIALVDIKSAVGKSLKSGEFKVILYAADPTWKLRSAADKYYKLFPQYFANKVKHAGGWDIPFYAKKSQQSKQEIVDGGYRFVWGAEEESDADWKWNKKNNRLNLIYIEPEFFQFSMGDYEAPSNAQTFARMQKLSENDSAEWEKFLPLHYSKAYNCNPHASNVNRKDFLYSLIKASFVSGIYDSSNNIILNIANRKDWIGDSGMGAMIPCNINPAIPNGRGSAVIKDCIYPLWNEITAKGLPTPDGLGLDCFMDIPEDYRRENFQYSKLQLSFDPVSKKTMVPAGFGSIEWLREISEKLRPTKGVIMANAFGPILFATPYIDIYGIENTYVLDPEKIRVFAGPARPVTYLPYTPQAKPGIEYHMFWGIYPGRNVTVDVLRPMIPVMDKLFKATWQPVTYATASNGIKIERFGKAGDNCIYFTINNPKTETVNTQLDFELSELGFSDKAKLQIIYPEVKSLTGSNTTQITLSPKQTIVISLSK